MNRRTFVVLGSGLVLGSGGFLVSRPVMAAGDTYPTKLRGKIDTFSGSLLKLTLRDGDAASARLSSSTRIMWLVRSQVSEIKPGSYIGTAAVSQPDGTLKALEVQVFPPAMRGVGEGSRGWDLGSGSSMTNGTVGTVTMQQGRRMTVTYNGGEKQVLVPDGVPIVTYEPADPSALTQGANVLVFGTHNADGSVVATSISVGRNGLVPPM